MFAPCPPFDAESARHKVSAAEDAWNTRDPARVVLAYTEDSAWRNRGEFLTGHAEIEAFLRRKWAAERDYALRTTQRAVVLPGPDYRGAAAPLRPAPATRTRPAAAAAVISRPW